MAKALWQGRISKRMSSSFEKMNRSIDVDIRLLKYDLAVNLCWCFELKRLKILSQTEYKKIQRAINKISETSLQKIPPDEDVHSFVERLLTKFTGNAGEKVHTGKSRNDQVVTDVKLYLKEEVPAISQSLKKLAFILVKGASKNINSIMPGYTHLQQAQPISLAHYLLSFATILSEDISRLESFEVTNLATCPLGSGAIAGTTLKINRERLAHRLGFRSSSVNSIASISDRSFLIELASILSIIAMQLSRYVEDLVIWSTSEFGFVTLDDSVSTGSSMMPQKKNPDSLELIRGSTGKVFGALTGLLTICKGLHLTYAKDLQDDKRFIFDAIDTVKSCLDVFHDVISSIKFNLPRMEAQINDYTLATDLADVATQNGLPFRSAYKNVAGLVKKGVASGLKLRELYKLKESKGLATATEFISLSPLSSIYKRGATGGTSPKEIKKQIKNLSTILRKQYN